MCGACEELEEREARARLAAQQAERERAVAQYRAALDGLTPRSPTPRSDIQRMVELVRSSSVDSDEREKLHIWAYRRYWEEVLADGRLVWWESLLLAELGECLGIDMKACPDLCRKSVIADANAGRLPRVDNVDGLMLEANEFVAFNFHVELMKDVAIREHRRAYSGLSVPLKGGLALETGEVRDVDVIVKTESQAVDSGMLTLTSRRLVFRGRTTTFEFAWFNLLSLTLYGRSLVLHAQGLEAPPLLRFAAGHAAVAAAIANTLARMWRGTWVAPTPDPPPPAELAASTPPANESSAEKAEPVAPSPIACRAQPALRDQDEATPQQPSAPTEASVQQGVTLDIPGVMALEVVDLSRAHELTDRHGKVWKAEGQLVIVTLRVRNQAKQPEKFASALALVEADGTVYGPWTGTAEQQIWFLGDSLAHRMLQPKMWEEGRVAFDVPPGVEFEELRVEAKLGQAVGPAAHAAIRLTPDASRS